MKRSALFAGVAAVATLTGWLGMAPVGAAGKAPGSGDIMPWALQAENPGANVAPVPLATAKIDAGNFDLIIAHAVAYSSAGEVKAMKTVNPKLKVLMYMNSTFAQAATSGPGPAGDYNQCPGQTHAFPTSWYETDVTGKTYIINPTSKNCLMVPTNPLWIANRVAMCETEAVAAGYDGCYLDDLGLGPLRAGYLNAPPVNPAKHAIWTTTDWLAATAALAKGVHTKVITKKLALYGNGLTDGPSYFTQKTSVIMGGVDGGIAEGWLRSATSSPTAFPTAAAWLQNVNMIGAVEKLGKPLLTLTKCWGPSPSSTCTAVDTQWLQYSLGSFLLGTGGKSMFFFSPSSSASRTSNYLLYSQAALGTPSGLMAASGAAYTRKFATGFVVVNPGTASVVVPLGGTYFTVPGGCANAATKTSETSLTMAKDTACILTTT